MTFFTLRSSFNIPQYLHDLQGENNKLQFTLLFNKFV